jgi:hypothetical protein
MADVEKVKRKLRQNPVDRMQDQLDRWKRSEYPADKLVAEVIEGLWDYYTEVWEDEHPDQEWTDADARDVIATSITDAESELRQYVVDRAATFMQEYQSRNR